MSSDYVKAEGTITVDDAGPPGGTAIDLRGANELIIIVEAGSDPINSFYGNNADFTAAFDATKFTMNASETHNETPDVFKYWFPICDTGNTATIRYKAVNARKGV